MLPSMGPKESMPAGFLIGLALGISMLLLLDSAWLAHLINSQLVEDILEHFIIVDHIIFILCIEVNLQEITSSHEHLAPCCCLLSSCAPIVPSSSGQCQGIVRPSADMPRLHLRSAASQREVDGLQLFSSVAGLSMRAKPKCYARGVHDTAVACYFQPTSSTLLTRRSRVELIHPSNSDLLTKYASCVAILGRVTKLTLSTYKYCNPVTK